MIPFLTILDVYAKDNYTFTIYFGDKSWMHNASIISSDTVGIICKYFDNERFVPWTSISYIEVSKK